MNNIYLHAFKQHLHLCEESENFKKWSKGAPLVDDVTSKNTDSSAYEDIGRLKREIKHDEDWFRLSGSREDFVGQVYKQWESFLKIIKEFGYKNQQEFIQDQKSENFKKAFNYMMDKGVVPFLKDNPDQEVKDAEREWDKREKELAANKENIKQEEEKVKNYGVLKTGKPVVVTAYHGSPTAGFEEFSDEELGSNTKAGSATLGHFFSGDPRTASGYAEGGSSVEVNTRGWFKLPSDARIEILNDAYRYWKGELTDEDDWYMFGLTDYPEPFIEEINESPSWFVDIVHDAMDAYDIEGSYNTDKLSPAVYKVYIRMMNPYVHDYEGSKYREQKYYDVIKKAKVAGHDGVILLNTYDSMDSSNVKDNIIVTFSKDNIKSATGNIGDYKEGGTMTEAEINEI